MRSTVYYMLCSLKNQIRKLFRTWIAVFIGVCVLLGVVVGLGASLIENLVDSAPAPPEAAVEQIEEHEAEEDSSLSMEFSTEEGLNLIFSALPETIIGAIILLVLTLVLMGADRSAGKIFLMADAYLLFPAPLPPQSILMFRLTVQLSAGLFGGLFYFLFQLPNLTMNLGLSLPQALALMLGLSLLIAYATLLQVFFYLLSSLRCWIKSSLRFFALGVPIAVVLLTLLQYKLEGALPLDSLWVNHPLTRLIPVWGWLKGFCMTMLEGDFVACLGFLAALIVGILLLLRLIYATPADYYEDALARSEETAQLTAQMRERKSIFSAVQKRKKDRGDRLMRDRLQIGAGANMFFFKAMYNRLRFACCFILTKTAGTYFFAVAAISLFFRYFLRQSDFGFFPSMIALGVAIFFRSLGNPLAQDVSNDSFAMIPERTWKKLFYSLLGGSANCLLDLLPAWLAATLLAGENPLTALVWILLFLTVDAYATAVGAFLALSAPVAAGQNIKLAIQILFLYFGLLPDVGLIVLGAAFSALPLAMLACAALNAALAAVFLCFSALCYTSIKPEP